MKNSRDFFKSDAFSSVLLLAVTALTLVWANSPWSSFYHSFFHTSFFSINLHLLINDLLMTLFFFSVGLEIKKELKKGQLSTPRRAALPFAAALGGMIVPAAIYFYFNPSGAGRPGWGIPMATDIAFAVGILSFFSSRIPSSLKIFLLALAIVDDLGAILVIALFYSESILWQYLGLASLLLGFILYLQKRNVTSYFFYWLIGLSVWFLIFRSGIHATVAGVALGLMTPIEPYPSQTQSPLDFLLAKLHFPVQFIILPLFALANAGVSFVGVELVEPLWANSIAIGIVAGLVVGKPFGILFFSWLSVRLGLTQLPQGVHWGQMGAVGALAGIGFTMALFISHLALKTDDLEFFSKSAILIGSTISAVLGMVTLGLASPSKSTAVDP